MVRKVSIIILVSLFFCIAPAAVGHALELDDILDKGLSNNDPYSSSLVILSEDVEGVEKLKLLDDAVLFSPDTPSYYFNLAVATMPNLAQSAIYFVDGIKAYKRSFWWMLSLQGLLLVSLLFSLFLSAIFIVVIKLPRDIPRMVHDINESKAKLLIPLILLPVSYLGPMVFLGGLLFLAGLYFNKSDKWVVYLLLLSMAATPFFGSVADRVYSASTPETRAMVEVSEGRDNLYALKVLKDRPGYEQKFTYATALKREGQPAEAAALFENLVREYPTQNAYINLGNAYFATKDTDKAKQAYKKALAKDKNVLVLYNLSQAHRDSFEYALGDKYYEEAQALDPQALGAYQEINGKNYNRAVIDARLTGKEIMAIALQGRRSALPLVGDYKRTGLGGLALLILFAILDSVIKRLSFRCTKCDSLACDLCADPTIQSNDLLCSECLKGHGVEEDTSAKARLSRMLEANQEKARMVTRIRVLSVAPPGLAQAYSGRIGKAFVFMMFFILPVVLLVLNPYFTTGLSDGSHSWLWILTLPFLALNYIVSFVTVNRRLDKGWL